MALKTLKLTNFRSYKQAEFRFSAGTNLVVGRNGSGKTNLLESVYVLSSARSFRGHDQDMVSYGAEGYLVDGQSGKDRLQVAFSGGKKQLRLNRKIAKPDKFVGRLPAVLFEPASTNIVAGPPEERRRFLNRLLAAIDKRYLRALITYKRIIRQRNALLRQRPPGLRDQLFGWDIKLVEQAGYIYQARHQLLLEFNAKVNEAYQAIAKTSSNITLSATPAGGPNYQEGLLSLLNQNLERDLALGHTTAGPHRDDVFIGFDEQLVTTIASRGEQRTLTLALKLLELEHIEQTTGNRPLVLLDDVFSELDSHRRQHLLERVKGYQTIITATETKGLKASLPRAHAKIELGKANARRRQNLSAKKSRPTRSGARAGAKPSAKSTRSKLSQQSPGAQSKRRGTKTDKSVRSRS